MLGVGEFGGQGEVEAQLVGVAEARHEAIELSLAVGDVAERGQLDPEHRAEEIEAKLGIITKQSDDRLVEGVCHRSA